MEEVAFNIASDFIKFHATVQEFKSSYSNIPLDVPIINSFFNPNYMPPAFFDRVNQLLQTMRLSAPNSRSRTSLPGIRKHSASTLKVASNVGIDTIPPVQSQLIGFVANAKVPDNIMAKAQEIIQSRENDSAPTNGSSSFADYLKNKLNMALQVETSPPSSPKSTTLTQKVYTGSFPASPKSPSRMLECMFFD